MRKAKNTLLSRLRTSSSPKAGTIAPEAQPPSTKTSPQKSPESIVHKTPETSLTLMSDAAHSIPIVASSGSQKESASQEPRSASLESESGSQMQRSFASETEKQKGDTAFKDKDPESQ